MNNQGMQEKVIFLDRDGTINVDFGYVHDESKFVLCTGAIEGMKILRSLGYKLIVITNQSGIERGYYTNDDFIKLSNYVDNLLASEGIYFAGIYHCPHWVTPCNCRKPKTQLFYDAARDWNINFMKSYVIGDKIRDLSICKEQPVKGILVGCPPEKNLPVGIVYQSNLLEAAKFIAESEKGQSIYEFE